jgi:hypothetical protein
VDEKGCIVVGKIVLQIIRHDKFENGRKASFSSFVTNRFSMSYR